MLCFILILVSRLMRFTLFSHPNHPPLLRNSYLVIYYSYSPFDPHVSSISSFQLQAVYPKNLPRPPSPSSLLLALLVNSFSLLARVLPSLCLSCTSASLSTNNSVGSSLALSPPCWTSPPVCPTSVLPH